MIYNHITITHKSDSPKTALLPLLYTFKLLKMRFNTQIMLLSSVGLFASTVLAVSQTQNDVIHVSWAGHSQQRWSKQYLSGPQPRLEWWCMDSAQCRPQICSGRQCQRRRHWPSAHYAPRGSKDPRRDCLGLHRNQAGRGHPKPTPRRERSGEARLPICTLALPEW